MTKTDTKHGAQDRLLSYMAQAILSAQDGGDDEMAEEMRRQAIRAMKLFGVSGFAGIA